MATLPKEWMPGVKMARIIGHWTAGGHTANETDKKAYHILIQGDGLVVRGVASIADNSGSLKSGYAAHTLNCNTNSIGVSMCAMAGSRESPFDPGHYPITRVQWDVFIDVVAQLCVAYDIPVTSKTVLTHAEVQTNLGIAQRNKWDVTRLVFEPSLVGAKAVGDHMRRKVSERVASLGSVSGPAPEPIPSGAVASVVASADTASTFGGVTTGRLPVGTLVEVLEQREGYSRVKTPAGYVVWVVTSALRVEDGPPVEQDSTPDKIRELLTEVRGKLDLIESLL